jgi:hypothetical protein
VTLNPIDASFTDDDLREMFSGDIPRRRQIAFYMDENIMSAFIQQELDAANIFVTTAIRRGMAEEDSDVIVLSDARSIGTIFVTTDYGFERLSERILAISGASHAGIMLFNQKYGEERIAARLLRYHEKYEEYGTILHNQLVTFGR